MNIDKKFTNKNLFKKKLAKMTWNQRKFLLKCHALCPICLTSFVVHKARSSKRIHPHKGWVYILSDICFVTLVGTTLQMLLLDLPEDVAGRWAWMYSLTLSQLSLLVTSSWTTCRRGEFTARSSAAPGPALLKRTTSKDWSKFELDDRVCRFVQHDYV